MAKRKQIDDQKILQIALDEFSAKRFDEVSINTIIASSGISKGSFYYRFADKTELYITLLKKGVEAKWQFISQELGGTVPDDLFELFEVQAKAGYRFAEIQPQYAELARRFNEEKGSPHHEQAMKELKGDDNGGLDTMIDRACSTGQFSSVYSKEFITQVISLVFSSYEDLQRDGESPEKTLEQLIRFMRLGLTR